ncbi:hypothetical protein GCM10027404_33090 [Arthrobacter tumbae]
MVRPNQGRLMVLIAVPMIAVKSHPVIQRRRYVLIVPRETMPVALPDPSQGPAEQPALCD